MNLISNEIKLNIPHRQIHVVVVTYNGMNWIKKCIDSLLDSDIDIIITIVDNLSTDGTYEFLLENYKSVTLIRNKFNLGFGAANNIAIDLALNEGADFVFLLNQDAYVEINTISNLVSEFKDLDRFGILCPIQLNGDNSKLDYNFSLQLNPIKCPNFYSDLYFNNLKNIYDIEFSNASAWLISKECLLKVGKFDNIFKLYGEDNNFVQRMKFHSFSIGIVTTSRYYHDREFRKGAKTISRLYLEEKIDILLIILNINIGFSVALFKSLIYIFRSMVLKILKLRLMSLLHDLNLIFFLIFNTRNLLLKRSNYRDEAS